MVILDRDRSGIRCSNDVGKFDGDGFFQTRQATSINQQLFLIFPCRCWYHDRGDLDSLDDILHGHGLLGHRVHYVPILALHRLFDVQRQRLESFTNFFWSLLLSYKAFDVQTSKNNEKSHDHDSLYLYSFIDSVATVDHFMALHRRRIHIRAWGLCSSVLGNKSICYCGHGCCCVLSSSNDNDHSLFTGILRNKTTPEGVPETSSWSSKSLHLSF